MNNQYSTTRMEKDMYSIQAAKKNSTAALRTSTSTLVCMQA